MLHRSDFLYGQIEDRRVKPGYKFFGVHKSDNKIGHFKENIHSKFKANVGVPFCACDNLVFFSKFEANIGTQLSALMLAFRILL